MYAPQKIQVFSSLRRPEINLLHQQGHQRACELTGLINIIQITVITVHEEEHQKTHSPKNLENGLFGFQILQLFCHYLRKS